MKKLELRQIDKQFFNPNYKIIGLDVAMRNNGVCVWGPCGLRLGVLPIISEGAAKLPEASDAVEELLDKEKPEFVAIEGYSYGSKFGRAFDMAEVGGVFRMHLYRRNIRTIEVPPGVLKRYITGNGKAGKPLIKRCIEKMFNIKIKNSDEADAFVLALIAYDYFMDESESKIPRFQSYLRKNVKQIAGGSLLGDLLIAKKEINELELDYVKDYFPIETKLNELQQIRIKALK